MSPRKVLDVAMTAYWHADDAGVSVNSICRMADISKPSLYREFGNEDGLMRAALDHYIEHILPGVFGVFSNGTTFRQTMDALVDYACTHPTTECGCLFYKMRAVRHRLGPRTRERVDEMTTRSRAFFAEFLQSRRKAGDWTSPVSRELAARYLVDQIGFALMQRASGDDPDEVRDTLKLALSALDGPQDPQP
ncbi:MAG: TetR/AcrR family transcriptional regulator [Pseudomonadota bacterium]